MNKHSLRTGRANWPICLLIAGLCAWAPAGAADAPSAEDVAAAAQTPLYRSKLPPALTLQYRLSKGGWTGNGELSWAPQGKRYESRLRGRVMGVPVISWVSTGSIDSHGMAPDRFTDERRGKSMRVADFQHAAQLIRYSDSEFQAPLPAGAQDRLSWMLQMAGVASAAPKRMAAGEKLSFFVSGARSDANMWTFQVIGKDAVTTSKGDIAALKLIREPRKIHDTRVEVWLDPARHYVPIRARLTNSEENDTLELLLEDMQTSS